MASTGPRVLLSGGYIPSLCNDLENLPSPMGGSPMVLSLWLREYFILMDAPEDRSYFTIVRRKKLYMHSSISEWLEILASKETEEIGWYPPIWDIPNYILKVGPFPCVVLPGLKTSTYYPSSRIMRQYGLKQLPWLPFDSSECVCDMTPSFGENLALWWKDATYHPFVREPSSICLTDAYLDFYEKEVDPDHASWDLVRESILGEGYIPGMEIRRVEALCSSGNDVSNPMDLWLKSDYYERRKEAVRKYLEKERARVAKWRETTDRYLKKSKKRGGETSAKTSKKCK